MSPREEIESRVIAMLLGEADDFEKTELEAILSNDASLSAFRDEMVKSIDIVGEAAVSVAPVGGITDAPKLSPSRRHEVEQAWSGGTSASTKTATMLGPLAKMHPFVPLVMAAGVGLAAGTALVTFNNDDNAVLSDSSSQGTSSPKPSGNADGQGAPAEGVSGDLEKRSVYGLPEGTEVGLPSSEETDEQDLEQKRKQLDEKLKDLSKEPVKESTSGRLDLDRETEGFEFDSKGIVAAETGSGASANPPGILRLGPPNVIALTEDNLAASPDSPTVPPVPNVPHFELKSGQDDNLLAKADGLLIPFARSVFGKDSQEKRELLAKHETIATYKGCGPSGIFATFVIEQYLDHEKIGPYGSAEQAQHLIQVSDFRRNSVGDPKIIQLITELKEGDLVWLSWNHHHVTHKGSSAPDWPVTKFRKLTPEEEKQHLPR